mmetsp:Transcript_37225/g.102731  ORF Transcript_37225/g.102731 Transcript_37225/m.102731 type:complete len:217 (-) Transcript_37225:664-1314(-)
MSIQRVKSTSNIEYKSNVATNNRAVNSMRNTIVHTVSTALHADVAEGLRVTLTSVETCQLTPEVMMAAIKARNTTLAFRELLGTSRTSETALRIGERSHFSCSSNIFFVLIACARVKGLKSSAPSSPSLSASFWRAVSRKEAMSSAKVVPVAEDRTIRRLALRATFNRVVAGVACEDAFGVVELLLGAPRDLLPERSPNRPSGYSFFDPRSVTSPP